MIGYERTEWYGVTYLFRMTGSSLPRCLPWVLFAGFLGGFCAGGVIDRAGWPIRDFFGHPYAMQVLGLVFGYLSITRLNVSYTRYWEGISHIKVMHSKWMAAYVQLLSFDRVSSFEAVSSDPFSIHLTRIFSQMSAVSIMKLHVDDWDEFFDELAEGATADEDAVAAAAPQHPGGEQEGASAERAPVLTSSAVDGRARCAGGSDGSVHGSTSSNSSGGRNQRSNSNESDPSRWRLTGSLTGSFVQRLTSSEVLHERTKQRDAEVEKLLSPEEATFYKAAPDATTAALARLMRALTTRQLAGGMSAPSPMVARALQDLSQGLEAFNSAMKMKEAPVPFAYVQVNALLLLVFNSLTPIAIACFSSPDKSPSDDGTFDDDYDRTLHVFVSCVLSMVVVAGFTAMWLVANELEDPFGSDANDIDVLTYHRKFVSTLDHLCKSAWMTEDQ